MTPDALSTFRARQGALADAIYDLAPVVSNVDPEQGQRLFDLAERTRDGTFHVVLLGCFSSGKSTLLNALLGQPVMPVKVNPCTAVLTEVRWADAPNVTIQYTDGRHEDLDVSTFIARFQLQTDDADDPTFSPFADVDRAIVGWPLPLLNNGVVLLDTPGLDDDPSRTARTLTALPSADAVLMVLNATRFLTALERSTIASLGPMGLTTLFFPVAMSDLVDALADDPDSARRDLLDRAHTHLDPLAFDWDARVHWIDGRSAVRARQAGAPVPPAFADFEAALTRFLVDDRGPARLHRTVEAVFAIEQELGRRRALERSVRETSLTDLAERRAALQPQLDRVHAVARRVERIADAFVRDESERVWRDLSTFLAETEAALPDVVDNIDVGGLAALDLLVPSGRARVEARLREGLQRWLDARMQQWRDQSAPALEQALVRLQTELAAESETFTALKTDVLDAFTAGAMVIPDASAEEPGPNERWFAVAIGAVLLSPGTVAAGWNQGYEGILKGAAGRIGARLGVLALGALLGPPGWVGLVVYVLADTLLVLATGGTQLARARSRMAGALQGRLVQQATDAREAIIGDVAGALGPFRDALVRAAQDDADALTKQLDAVVLARERADHDAHAQDRAYDALDDAIRNARTRLVEPSGPAA